MLTVTLLLLLLLPLKNIYFSKIAVFFVLFWNFISVQPKIVYIDWFYRRCCYFGVFMNQILLMKYMTICSMSQFKAMSCVCLGPRHSTYLYFCSAPDIATVETKLNVFSYKVMFGQNYSGCQWCLTILMDVLVLLLIEKKNRN